MRHRHVRPPVPGVHPDALAHVEHPVGQSPCVAAHNDQPLPTGHQLVAFPAATDVAGLHVQPPQQLRLVSRGQHHTRALLPHATSHLGAHVRHPLDVLAQHRRHAPSQRRGTVGHHDAAFRQFHGPRRQHGGHSHHHHTQHPSHGISFHIIYILIYFYIDTFL